MLSNVTNVTKVFSKSLERVNDKCYKNGKRISCNKFAKESRKLENVETGFWDNLFK